MFKKFLIILFFFISCGVSASGRGFDMNFPLSGESIANNTLQFYVVKDLYSILSKKYPVCSDYKVVNTQIIHYPYDVKKKNNKYIDGYWQELWTVNCCGKLLQIPVTFHINKKETVFEIDKNILRQEE